MNHFSVAELERLEEVICPRCGGMGELGSPSVLVHDGHDTSPLPPLEFDRCELCNGERHVWRLRPSGGGGSLNDRRAPGAAEHVP